MKILVPIIYLCVLVMVALVSHTIGQGNPKIIFVDITAEILEAGFELHGIEQCILQRGENGGSPHLFFYENTIRVANPNRERAFLFLSNSLRNKYTEEWLENNEED